MFLINARYIKEEVEDSIGKILDKVIIGDEIGHLVENMVMIITEDMEEVEIIFRRGCFGGRTSNNVG